MAYTDPQYQFTHSLVAPVVTGTATASATNGVNVTAQLHSPPSAFTVTKLRVFVTVVPKTGSMGLVLTVMNGTNTVGAATMGTNTAAGNFKDATLTAANVNVPADAVLTAVVTGTATASADTIGTMAVHISGHDTFA